MASALTEDQIKKFVAAWYLALDQHVSTEDAYTFLADERLNMQFRADPDGDMRDLASFKSWYERITCLYFDENHTVQSVTSSISGGEAVVDIVVGWQASIWEPPAAKSKRVSMEATQRWTIRSSSKNGYGLEIVTYEASVAPTKFAPGFALLPEKAYKLEIAYL
jgi:hypothetical protein